MGKKGFFNAAKRKREMAKQEKRKLKAERKAERRSESEAGEDGAAEGEPLRIQGETMDEGLDGVP